MHAATGEELIFAVIRAGGKQYRVQQEQTLDVDLMPAQAGSMVEFRDVLLIDDAGEIRVGAPFVEGARVVAEVINHGRDKKIFVFKYKNKTRYRRRHGHRQAYTRLAIRQILTDGQQKADQEAKPVKAQRKRTATRKEEPAEARAEASAPALQATEGAAEPKAAAAAAKRAARPRKAAEPAAGKKPAARTRAKKNADTESD